MCYNRQIYSNRNFNPRPPCGGRRRLEKLYNIIAPFQSTSPVWRTTGQFFNQVDCQTISIHVPRVEDDIVRKKISGVASHFNPRPPCGGRRTGFYLDVFHDLFQSTSPVWRTTEKRRRLNRKTLISIHVPRVEDDFCGPQSDSDCRNFNPRPPCGGRRSI